MHSKAALQFLELFRTEFGWVGLLALHHQRFQLGLSRQTPALPGLRCRQQHAKAHQAGGNRSGEAAERHWSLQISLTN